MHCVPFVGIFNQSYLLIVCFGVSSVGSRCQAYKLAHSQLSALPSIALLKRYFSYTYAKKSTLSEALCRGGDVGSAIGMLNEIAQRKA